MEASKIQKPFMPPPSVPAPPPPIRPPNSIPPAPPIPYSQEKIPSFVQRQERDTFGVKDTYIDSWGRAEAAKLDYDRNHHERPRSRSRDRENFSESVWDRSEVEGPPSTGSEQLKEREKRDKERQYEMSQIQRERESHKVYQPRVVEKERSKPIMMNERATFKTHMAHKSAMERERKGSVSTLASHKEKYDDTEMVIDDYTTPAIPPAPVLAPQMMKSPASACLTYNRIPWKLRVRKEVFRPNEPLGPPMAMDLLFVQVAADIYGTCMRISPQERRQAASLLNSHGINVENVRGQVRTIVKRNLIDMARSWPLYFARLFAVSGGSPQFPDISILAISHNGVYLARRENDFIMVLKTIAFGDLQNAVSSAII